MNSKTSNTLKHNENKAALWSGPFFIIIFVNIAVNTSLQLYNNSMSLYVVDKLGGLAQFAGMTLTFFTFAALFTRIIAGRLLDKLNHRRVLVFGLIIFAVVNFSFSFFPELKALPYLRFLQGIGYAMSTTSASVCVTDILPKNRMTEGIGYFGLGTSVAQAIGPATALALISAGNYHNIFYTATGLILLTITVLVTYNYKKSPRISLDTGLKNDTIDSEEALQSENLPADTTISKNKIYSVISSLIERKALPCTALQLMLSMANSVTVAFLTLYATKQDIGRPSLFFILSAICIVISRVCFGKFADKYGPLSTLIPGIISYTLCYTFLILSKENEISYYIAGILSGFGNGLTMPTLNACAVKAVAPSRRGAAIATYMLAMDAGVGLGSWLWGVLIDSSGFSSAFIGCIFCCVIAFILSLTFFRRKTHITA